MENVAGPLRAVEEPEIKVLKERRRPGRIENASPELIALMRGTVEVQEQPLPPQSASRLPSHSRPQDNRGRNTEAALWTAIAVWVVIGACLITGRSHWITAPLGIQAEAATSHPYQAGKSAPADITK